MSYDAEYRRLYAKTHRSVMNAQAARKREREARADIDRLAELELADTMRILAGGRDGRLSLVESVIPTEELERLKDHGYIRAYCNDTDTGRTAVMFSDSWMHGVVMKSHMLETL